MSCSPDVPDTNTGFTVGSFKFQLIFTGNWWKYSCQRHFPISYLFYGESIKILISLNKWLPESHL